MPRKTEILPEMQTILQNLDDLFGHIFPLWISKINLFESYDNIILNLNEQKNLIDLRKNLLYKMHLENKNF